MTRVLDFVATDRWGNGRTGRVATETPAQLAERLYRLRYQSATITDRATGEIVGRVGKCLDGKRTWWAAS